MSTLSKYGMIHLILFVTFFSTPEFPLAAVESEIIPVKHRLPGEIAKAITPALEPAEVVVAVPSGLLVKAGPQRVVAIGKLISALDRPLKNLIVTVLHSSRTDLEQLNAGVGAAIRLPDGTVRGRGFWQRSQSAHSQGSKQSLKILEGHPAFIAIGQDRPTPVIQIYGYPPRLLSGIRYKPITQGFKVLPKMVKCNVRLEISPWSEQLKGGTGIAIQRASTTLETNLGQWVELTSQTVTEQNQSSPILGRRYTTRRGKSRVFLKVEAPQGC